MIMPSPPNILDHCPQPSLAREKDMTISPLGSRGEAGFEEASSSSMLSGMNEEASPSSMDSGIDEQASSSQNMIMNKEEASTAAWAEEEPPPPGTTSSLETLIQRGEKT